MTIDFNSRKIRERRKTVILEFIRKLISYLKCDHEQVLLNVCCGILVTTSM